MKRNKAFLILILFITIYACDNNRILDHTQKISDEKWEIGDIYSFDVTVADTTKIYDINVHLRNSTRYEYSNIWLFIETQAPNGNMLKDTVEFVLADETGQWLGRGLGDINATLLPYKKGVRFPYRGVYKISLEQAMRENPLDYILDIGIQIKVHKTKK